MVGGGRTRLEVTAQLTILRRTAYSTTIEFTVFQRNVRGEQDARCVRTGSGVSCHLEVATDRLLSGQAPVDSSVQQARVRFVLTGVNPMLTLGFAMFCREQRWIIPGGSSGVDHLGWINSSGSSRFNLVDLDFQPGDNVDDGERNVTNASVIQG